MALSLKCIIDGHSPKVIALIDKIALGLYENDERPTIDAVFEGVLNAGFEIDRQVMAYAYRNSDVVSQMAYHSKPSTIENFEAKGMKRAVRMATRKTNSHSTSDEDSIAVFVAKSVASVFGQVTGKRTSSKSVTKALQDKIMAIVRQRLGEEQTRKLKESKTATQAKLTSFDIISRAFALADLDSIVGTSGIKGLKKAVGSLADIEADILNALTQLGDSINPSQKALYDEMIQGVRDASIDILLTKTDFRKILSNELIGLGYGKEIENKGVAKSSVQSGKRTVVDWNKVKNALAKGGGAEILGSIANDLGRSFSPQEVALVMGHLSRMVDEIKARHLAKRIGDINKEKNKTDKPNMDAIDKLVDLERLGYFDASTSAEIMKAMGTKGLNDDLLAEMQTLLRDMRDIEKGVSLTYREEYSRAIKQILQKMDAIGEKTAQKGADILISGAKDVVDVSTSGLLTTIMNLTENSTSGVFKTIRTTLSRMLFDFIGAKGDIRKVKAPQLMLFWSSFTDALLGGVTQIKSESTEVIKFWETSPTSFMNRINFQTSGIIENLKKKKGYRSLPLSALKVIGSVMSSFVMINSAFDTAHGSVQVFNSKVASIREAMLRMENPATGELYTRFEVSDIISEHLYGKEATKKAKEMTKKLIEDSGLLANRSNMGKFRRIYKEVLFGNFAKHIEGGMALMDMIETSSINLANRELGRISDIKASPAKLIEGGMEIMFRPKSGGKPNKFAFLGKRVNFAVGGAEHWFIQGLQRRGFGLILGLYDLGGDIRKRLYTKQAPPTLFLKYDANFSTQTGIKEYTELLERKKNIIARMQRGTIDFVATTFLAKMAMNFIQELVFGNDDDDDDEEQVNEKIRQMVKYPVTKRGLTKGTFLEFQQKLLYAYDPKTKRLDEQRMTHTLWDIVTDLPNTLHYLEQNLTNQGVFGRINKGWHSVEIYNKYESEENKRKRRVGIVLTEMVGMLKVPFDANYQIGKGELMALEAMWTDDYQDVSKLSVAQRKKYIDQLNYFRDNWGEAMMFQIAGQTLYERFKGAPVSEKIEFVRGATSQKTYELLESLGYKAKDDLKKIGKKGELDEFINLTYPETLITGEIADESVFSQTRSAVQVHNTIYEVGKGGVELFEHFDDDDIAVIRGVGVVSIDTKNLKDLKIIQESVEKGGAEGEIKKDAKGNVILTFDGIPKTSNQSVLEKLGKMIEKLEPK